MSQTDWPLELVEAAARAFYQPETQTWAVPPLLERNLRRALDAIADQIVLKRDLHEEIEAPFFGIDNIGRHRRLVTKWEEIE